MPNVIDSNCNYTYNCCVYYSFLTWLGNRSATSEMNNGSSSSINLDKFMSRKTRITIVDSLSLEFSRLAAPNERRTDRMLRKPKS